MARSAALNPASTPFFPGAPRSEDDGSAGSEFRAPTLREQGHIPTSFPLVSSAEYRSMRSSPSPSQPGRDRENSRDGRLQQSPIIRRSPHQKQSEKLYGSIESQARDINNMSGLETLQEGDDHPGPAYMDNGGQMSAHVSNFFANMLHQGRVSASSQPVATVNSSSRSSSFNTTGPFTSSSPVSSLDSGSQFAPSMDSSQGLEAQLKSSPLILDLLDRLVRCEYSAREIQKDLGDVSRKVNLLVERTLNNSLNNRQPEFKDPFAPSVGIGGSFSSIPSGPRGSFANIAPNQSPPSDDIVQISQRLNTLTTSVGQLLALQTQQHIQNTTAMHTNPNLAGQGLPQTPDMSTVQMFSPALTSNASLLGHGLPNRPDLRPSPRIAPNSPMRTWSAGTLDLPLRPDSIGSVGRTDTNRNDKRRSVTGGMIRRESAGMLESHGSDFSGGSPRDGGPMVSKWDQLNLAPDLLRSLNKFGVGPPNKIQQRALPFLLRGADIIAQAPPTQERIAAYVIPAIQIAVVNSVGQPPHTGPIVVMISTTVDQATQAQRMIRDLGGPIGIRSALGVGATSVGSDLNQELRLLQQNMPHIICGTPQKLNAIFTSPGGISGSDVRFLVLDEVDQLIARNLHDYVFNIVKLLPSPRSRPLGSSSPNATSSSGSQTFSSFDGSGSPSLASDFPTPGRRFSTIGSSPNPSESTNNSVIERQTALFSNTVPQDVLNLATAIQLKEPVRVLVRRDGNVTHSDNNQGSRGLRQYYLYLAFTAGGRSDPLAPAPPGGGLGIIGSGRGASSAESAQAREWKLDALADLFDDIDIPQAIVHVGGMTSLDSVVYKLASRGLEAVPLHGDMNAGIKLAALNKFRSASSGIMRQTVTKVLVVYDVTVKSPEVSHVPLVINYDLPKAVEEYAHRVAPAIASSYTRAGVVINFVTATGGDVEMLRSIECFYKIKCPEVPITLRDIL